jgi:hypothetical protein
MALTHTCAGGLSVDCKGEWEGEYKDAINKHVKVVDGTREVLGLQGEAIIMALTCRSELFGAGL